MTERCQRAMERRQRRDDRELLKEALEDSECTLSGDGEVSKGDG